MNEHYASPGLCGPDYACLFAGAFAQPYYVLSSPASIVLPYRSLPGMPWTRLYILRPGDTWNALCLRSSFWERARFVLFPLLVRTGWHVLCSAAAWRLPCRTAIYYTMEHLQTAAVFFIYWKTNAVPACVNDWKRCALSFVRLRCRVCTTALAARWWGRQSICRGTWVAPGDCRQSAPATVLRGGRRAFAWVHHYLPYCRAYYATGISFFAVLRARPVFVFYAVDMCLPRRHVTAATGILWKTIGRHRAVLW